MLNYIAGTRGVSISLFVLAAFLLLPGLISGGSAAAQSGLNRSKAPQTQPTPAATDTNKNGVMKLSSTVVNIAAVVTDHDGHYVPKLTKDDFELFEDGKAQQVAFFGNEEVPLNVALMIDVSQSVSNSLKDIKKAAIAFVHQLRPADKVMVIAFDQQVLYLTDFTNDSKRLESAINGCQTGRGTSVYEAVYDTVTQRFRGVEGRKVIMLLSDGEDTTSRTVGYDQTVERVAQSDVLVYGLRYPDTGFSHGHWGHGGGFPGSRWPLMSEGGQWGQHRGGGYGHHRRDNRDFMKDVTEAGGGPVYDAKTTGDLAKRAPEIADELRHVYTLGYYPTKPLSDGGYRTVDVKIKGRGDVSVRHRQGYDPRQTAPQPTN